MCSICDFIMKSIDKRIEKKDNELEETLENEGYIASKKTVKAVKQLEEEIAGLLEDETDYIISKISESVNLETFSEKVWHTVKMNDALAVKLTLVFKEQFYEFMTDITELYLQKTDRKLVLSSMSKRSIGWIESWSKELGNIMQLNSHTEIETILKKGLEKGLGCNEVTREILESGIRDEWYKAQRVALTEVLRAHSAAQQEAFMQSPSVVKKMWRHTGNYRNEPRPNHIAMDGKIVDKNKPFSLVSTDGKFYAPMYPRDTNLPPSESVNCHCIIEPIADESILGLSLKERQKLQQEAIDNMDNEWERELDEKNKAKAGIEI